MYKYIQFLILFFLISYSGIAQHQRYHTDEKYSIRIDSAKSLYDNGLYTDAINMYTNILIDYPDDYLSYLFRGDGKMQLRQYKEAKIDFILAVAMKKTSDIALFRTGQACFFLKQYKEAIHYFDDAIELEPSKGEFYYYRGVSKGITGDKDGGCKDLYRALDNNYEKANVSIKNLCNDYQERKP